ncbi:MAG TPA: hypothetical protein VFZ16_18880 [Hyphomicrobiaceae bacterium]|nr:hypothetical protein [Hyphomicrobiaceae bacterium]
MSQLARLIAIALVACVGADAARADRGGWMTESAMRTAFIGKTLDGHYADGMPWTETYAPNGRLDYRDQRRAGPGDWHFRDNVFCTFYDPGYGLNGGCFRALRTSANCYEFYLAGLGGPDDEAGEPPAPLRRWVARAALRDAPSTCQEQPSV